MNSETLYRRVPVSERKPKESGKYTAKIKYPDGSWHIATEKQFTVDAETQGWPDSAKWWKEYVEYWLEPVTGIVLTEQELKAVRKEAFDAGEKFSDVAHSLVHENITEAVDALAPYQFNQWIKQKEGK